MKKHKTPIPPKPSLTPLARWVINTDKELQDIKYAIISLQQTLKEIKKKRNENLIREKWQELSTGNLFSIVIQRRKCAIIWISKEGD